VNFEAKCRCFSVRKMHTDALCRANMLLYSSLRLHTKTAEFYALLKEILE
jgi:hypothetical protein